MDILPSDLGLRRNVAILRLRAISGGTGTTGNAGAAGSFLVAPLSPQTSNGAPRSLGLFGRLWTRGLDLDDASKAAVLDAMKPMSFGMVGGIAGGAGGGFAGPAIAMFAAQQTTMAIVFGTLGVVFGTIGCALPGALLRGWQKKPVSVGEIETILHSIADDPLEKTFLTLARDISNQSGELPEGVAQEVRHSLKAIGEALDRLPQMVGAASGTTLSENVDLLAQAERAREEAIEERDPIIAASLLRRAEAQAGAAQAAGHSALLIRRSKALRDELAAQIESLRLGMLSYQSGATDTTNLARVAQSVRKVATEASEVTRASAELDSAVRGDAVSATPISYRPAPAIVEEPQVLRQGVGGQSR